MVGCCDQNQSQKNKDVEIEKNNIKNISFLNSNNKNIKSQYIVEEENQNKNHPKVIATKSNQSSGSESLNKVKCAYPNENVSNKDQNISICNNTLQMNNSNFIKKNLNNNAKPYNYNIINELRHKNSIINYNKIGNINLKENIFDIKTKIIFFGDLFSNDIIEINKFGMKNGLRKKNDGLSIFGIKENNNINLENINIYDYYFDLGKFEEKNNNLSGIVFEIYINKKTKNYTLYFLHNSLILYYKIHNNFYFDIDKDYYLILGDIFLSIIVKTNQEKIIYIQTEIENEEPKKYSFKSKDMPIKIGRVNCQINIKRPSISKLHSIIDFNYDNFFYKDCGSTNGSTLLIREDDSLKINGEMNFKLEDASFKIKELDDEDNYIEETF